MSTAVTVLEPLRRVRENHRHELGTAMVHEVGQTVRELGGKLGEVAAIGLTNPSIALLATVTAIRLLGKQTVWTSKWQRVREHYGTSYYWTQEKEPEPILSQTDQEALIAVVATGSALSSLSSAVGGLLPAVLAFLTRGKT